MATSYYELLKHPNWQRKRLEVNAAAGWKCESCGEADRTLHVHHRHYVKGRKPWEYDLSELQCLCEDCHDRVTARAKDLQIAFGALGEGDQDQVVGYAKGLRVKQAGMDDIAVANLPPVIQLGGYEEIVGFSEAIGVYGHELLDVVEGQGIDTRLAVTIAGMSGDVAAALSCVRSQGG